MKVSEINTGLPLGGVSRADAPATSREVRKGAKMQRGRAVASDSARLGKAGASNIRDVTFTYDAGPQRDVANVRLHGSWNKRDGRYSAEWGQETVPMRPLGGGKWAATVRLVDDGAHPWEWGVFADTPGHKHRWAVHGASGNLKLDIGKGAATYAPTTYHAMGARKTDKGDLSFKVWLPYAREAVVRITAPDGSVTRIPMTRDGDDFAAVVKGGFKAAVGSSYMYEVVDSTGVARAVADPYALEVVGEQRGLSRAWFDPTSGAEIHQYLEPQMPFMRFEIRDEDGAAEAYVVLKDESGRQLSKSEVEARLGGLDPELRKKIAAGRAVDDLTFLTDDGRLVLRPTDGTWTTMVHNAPALHGLRYELQLWMKDPATGALKLHDDSDGDGKLSDVERRRSPDNDPISDRITEESGISFRESVIVDGVRAVDKAPRLQVPWTKARIYQMHVGSFLGSAKNSARSTFDDVLKKIDYVQSLGMNAIELLPVTEEQGIRGWGYAMGVVNMAVESSLGFERDGRWVSGREALDMLVDTLHARKMNVICDVVYNHALEKGNPLSQIDAKNPYYNWGSADKPEMRMTPWGPMPAFNNPRVRQFLIDHAVAQVLQNRFDGIRLDFTQPIYEMGGDDGRAFLQELVSQVREVAPDTLILPEDFSFKPWIVDLTGSLWYTEPQHRLVHDHDKSRPGLVQAAARGQRTNVDAFVRLLNDPFGLKSLTQSVNMISNHDEVGNADRTVTVAQGDKPTDDPGQWARDVSRMVMAVGLLMPGTPFFFQGDESLATNPFRWGKPSTWDLGWSWATLGPNWNWSALTFNDDVRATYERLIALGAAAEKDPAFAALAEADKLVFRDLAAMNPDARRQAYIDISRKLATGVVRDVNAIRDSAPKQALDGDAPGRALYAHNDDGVFAFTRGKDQPEYVVIGSVAKRSFENYRIDLPAGKWKQVMNTDDVRYGGHGAGVVRVAPFEGGDGVTFNVPAGGAIILQRV